MGQNPESTAKPEPVFNQKNTSFNQAEVYEGISLIQLQDHDIDTDDVVPEFNEQPVIAKKKAKTEEKKVDFLPPDWIPHGHPDPITGHPTKPYPHQKLPDVSHRGDEGDPAST